jgi:hypothetical protein
VWQGEDYRRLRKRKYNLDEDRLSPIVFPTNFQTTLAQCPTPGYHLEPHTHSTRKTQARPIPGRKSATGSTQNGAKQARKNQPYIRGDEDFFNQPYSSTKNVDFQLNCRERQLAASFPRSVHRMNKKEKVTRRKAINACYQSAAQPIPPPLASHTCGSFDTSAQGRPGLE